MILKFVFTKNYIFELKFSIIIVYIAIECLLKTIL